MKRINFLVIATAMASALTLLSCDKDRANNPIEEPSLIVEKDVLNKISALHFNPNRIEKVMISDIDGTKKAMYRIEDDIMLSKSQIMDMGLHGGIQNKQYRTNNLVTATNVIRVVGYTGNNQHGLSATAKTGLQYAVNNYNNENLRIRFQLSFGIRWRPNDILVYVDNSINPDPNRAAGIAGFPSNGYPFTRVRINNGANLTQTNQQLEHLLAHEIGHCIGFRHTDWDTRKTCGENSNERVGNDGLVYIPGTAGAGGDPKSIMNACYPANTDGEWSDLDRVALNYLY
ncbi:dual-action HEIGH metallo-peptidase [Aquimarina sp. MAR_2010_214]|uniref:M57 family metalloprotease n=1 Tax=Aquimarina sp. MAR_2010_214 TaxID=1250026 RepID=UPI000C702D82|nr:M57 family metalloprotease [Aquimarina sp. MAR_2010_214]PKV52549.1 dual-action HEIGH metallo-peptidase [Aquimarina sp. MAR_2010_214]